MKTTLHQQQLMADFNFKKWTIFIFLVVMVCRISATPMFRLKLIGNANFSDETVIYYQQGATAGFDSEYDSYKLMGPNPAPHIAQQYGTTLMQINGISPVLTSFSIQIKITTNVTDKFIIKASDVQDLPEGTAVYLIDRYTKDSIDILKNECNFMLSDTTSATRFILYVKGGSSLPTGIKQQVKQAPRLGSMDDNSFVLTFDQEIQAGLTAELFTLAGQTVQRAEYGNSEQVMLDYRTFQPGTYMLKITGDTQRIYCYKILLH